MTEALKASEAQARHETAVRIAGIETRLAQDVRILGKVVWVVRRE